MIKKIIVRLNLIHQKDGLNFEKNLEISIKSFNLDNFQHQNLLVLLSFTQHHQVNNFAMRKYILRKISFVKSVGQISLKNIFFMTKQSLGNAALKGQKT